MSSRRQCHPELLRWSRQSESSNRPRRRRSIDGPSSVAMHGLGQVIATSCYFLLTALRAATPEVTRNISLAVFVPLRCPRGVRVHNDATIIAAIEAANVEATDEGVVFAADVYDSCSEEESFYHLFHVLGSSKENSNVVVGPGNHALCESSARLLNLHKESLVSWGCTDSTLSDRAIYRTFARTSTSADTAVHAMSVILGHFRLHYVTIVFSSHLPESAIGSELHIHLTYHGFTITGFHKLTTDDFREALVAKLRAVDPRTKALVLCVTEEDTRPVLESLQGAGMTSGRHAIFLIKISTNLPLDVHGRLPGGFIVPSLQNASAAVTEALEAVFVLRAGALQVHGAAVEEKHLLFNARVYNAIMLATYAIRRAHTRGVHIDGYTVATYAQNVTFNGLHSIVTTNERAEVLLEFNLWDYRSESANFEVVLEFSKDLSNIKSRSAIRWPGGVALEGDACKFEECVAGIRDIETG